MDLQISLIDTIFYFGIPYDLYDQDPEKWNKVLKIFLHCQPNGRLFGTFSGLQFKVHVCRDIVFKYRGLHLVLISSVITRWARSLLQSDSNFSLSNNYNKYNIDKDVIITYQGGSGGHFLLNCLYLNDSSSCTTPPFFTTSKCTDILVSTLDNIEEKLNYIISRTEDQHIWTDPRIELNYKVQDHKIMITAEHLGGIEDILEELQIYPNYKYKIIIYYKNTKLFKYLREYEKYSPWPVVGMVTVKQTILQFIKKPQETKKKLIDLYNDKDQVYSHCYIDSKITFYVWDTNWYFSERDTIDHIKELYELLSLPGFDENAISKYYNVWIKTLDDLKTKALNEIT